jgi:hypothetical protein
MEILLMEDKKEYPEDASAEDMPTAFNQPQLEPAETPDIFLTRVSESLLTSPDVDADLARIVSHHLLTAATNANAVDNAKAAIDAIAATRAAQIEEQNDG